MTTLSIHLPDDMIERLKKIAKIREISLNGLMLELAANAVTEEETKKWFVDTQLRGNSKRALHMLDELDSLDSP